MKFITSLCLILICFSCNGQKNATTSETIIGSTEIGPLCPVEPCNLSSQQLKQFYGGFVVVLYDSKKKKVKSLALDQKGGFSIKVKPGNYFAEIQPKEGQAVNPPELRKIIVNKGKNSRVKLEYDTGIR